MNREQFRKDLEELINRYSMENGSATPDFMLADYLMNCLSNYEDVVNKRDKWHGTELSAFKLTGQIGIPTPPPINFSPLTFPSNEERIVP